MASAAMAVAFPRRVISAGDSDKASILMIQQRLNQLGCGPIPEDGDFGPKTTAAVELFQMRSADHFGTPLDMDGKVGPLTWASLFAMPVLPTLETATSPLLMDALTVAAGEVGQMEQPLGSNRGPRVDQYLRSVNIDPTKGSFAWCAAFVYFCFQQAANNLQVNNPVIQTGGVLDHWNRAVAAGIPHIVSADATATPSLVKPGMIFVIGNSAGHGHTGVVEKVAGTLLTTIEGNTNLNGSREGIGVFRRDKRTIPSINRGFIAYS